MSFPRQLLIVWSGLAIGIGIIILIILVIAPSDHFHHKITKTSTNTWHIYDYGSTPEKWINLTCQSEGKQVLQLHSVSDDYTDLDVVCK